jgi:hypothetical protein
MSNPDQQEDAAAPERVSDERIEERLQAHLAEFESLRKEMEQLQDGGQQYYTLALLLIGGIAAVLPFILDKAPQLIIPTMLTIPLFFSILGFQYFRQHEEIFVIAAYLRECVRPAVRQLLGDDRLWGWEEFKYSRFDRVFGSGLSRILGPTTIGTLLRSLIFLVPSLIALVAVCGVVWQSKSPFFITSSLILNVLLWAWFIASAAFTLLLFIRILSQGNFARRILGMTTQARTTAT